MYFQRRVQSIFGISIFKKNLQSTIRRARARANTHTHTHLRHKALLVTSQAEQNLQWSLDHWLPAPACLSQKIRLLRSSNSISCWKRNLYLNCPNEMSVTLFRVKPVYYVPYVYWVWLNGCDWISIGLSTDWSMMKDGDVEPWPWLNACWRKWRGGLSVGLFDPP